MHVRVRAPGARQARQAGRRRVQAAQAARLDALRHAARHACASEGLGLEVSATP